MMSQIYYKLAQLICSFFIASGVSRLLEFGFLQLINLIESSKKVILMVCNTESYSSVHNVFDCLKVLYFE